MKIFHTENLNLEKFTTLSEFRKNIYLNHV